MERLTKVTIFLVLSLLSQYCTTSENSTPQITKIKDGRYHCEEGRFLIKFEGTPFPERKTYDIGSQKLSISSFRHFAPNASRPKLVSQVAYMDNPPNSINVLDKDQLLEQMKVNALYQMGSYTILKEEKIEVGGHPGISLSAEVHMQLGTYRVAMKIFMVGERTYNLTIYAYPQLPTDKAEEFFGSFELTTPIEP